MIRRSLLPAIVFVCVGGCHRGGGSDIGPKLDPLPSVDYRVLVRDDAGRPVTGAEVRIAGIAAVSVTGSGGRSMLQQRPEGTRLVTVDGSAAAATDASRLGTLTVRATLPDGDELPYVVYLPDHAASAGLTVTTGVQASASLLDDRGTPSDAELSIAAGETITDGAAIAVELRTGALAAGHVPPVPGAPLLTTRAIFVHPASVRFAVGAALTGPDDLGLPSGGATLYHLDDTVGEWVASGSASLAGGRLAAPAGSVRRGGLYCFGVAAASAVSIRGRILDPSGVPVHTSLVRGPRASTRTTADGRFELGPIAGLDAAGGPHTVALEIDGGRRYLPVQTVTATTLAGADFDVGDVTLETRLSTNARIQMVLRGDLDRNRLLRISNRRFFRTAGDNGGDSGIAVFEDMVADVVGLITSRPRNGDTLFRSQSYFNLFATSVDNPIQLFRSESVWRPSAEGGTVLLCVDRSGTGPVSEAHVILGNVPGAGLVGRADLNGLFGTDIPRGGQATMVQESVIEGRRVVSAFTMVAPDTGRLELPLEQVRHRLGRFARFGMFAGRLTNAGASGTQAIRASGELTLQDFLEDTVLGRAPGAAAPVQVAPAAPGFAFRLGVPTGAGHLAAVEGTTTAGVFVLERMGLALGLAAAEGRLTAVDVDLGLPAATGFTIRNGVANLGVPAANLRFHLAGELDSGLLVDLCRDAGGVAVNGNDATVNLPALPLGLRRYVAVLGGEGVAAGGAAIRQHTIVHLDGQASPDVPLLPVPAIRSPANAATVSSSFFDIGFDDSPAGQYIVAELRSVTATDMRVWTAMIPRDLNSFRFFSFPTNVPQVLEAGRTWTIDISAWRIDTGPLTDPRFPWTEIFARIQTNWVGLTEADREVRAVSGSRITVTTN